MNISYSGRSGNERVTAHERNLKKKTVSSLLTIYRSETIASRAGMSAHFLTMNLTYLVQRIIEEAVPFKFWGNRTSSASVVFNSATRFSLV